MQLTESRNTPRREGDQVGHPVAANAQIFIGGLIALNANGYAVPATAGGKQAVGVSETYVDNRGGADGDQFVTARRSCFAFANSATAAIARADIGAVAYVEDDNTVAKTGTAIAGTVVDIADEGVWVDVGAHAIAIAAQA